MLATVIETPTFKKLSQDIWQADERTEFISFLANNPLSGDVIPNTNGLRKIRWAKSGIGKRGGVRVIYYNQLDNGHIYLITIYTKTKFDNLPNSLLNELKKSL
jgi:mRNA-degrading endonuclease RelE of RelBE toxin-antitoxin system